jgi:hypothetical protein
MTRFFSLRENQSRFSPKGKHKHNAPKKKKISTVDAARTPPQQRKPLNGRERRERGKEGSCGIQRGGWMQVDCLPVSASRKPAGARCSLLIIITGTGWNMQLNSEIWNYSVRAACGWSPSRPVWDVGGLRGPVEKKKCDPFLFLFLFLKF